MPDKNKIYQQIFNLVNNSQRILLTTHLRPDGDAVGSLLSFYQVLKNLGNPFGKLKAGQVEMFSYDGIPECLNFLPYINKIRNEQGWLMAQRFDLIIALDTGSFGRSGLEIYLKSLNHRPKTVNIDHHFTNDNFGDINLVDAEQSSVCEILFNLFKIVNLKLNDKLATTLLTGIIWDTDYFINPNTTHQTIQIAGELIKQGAKRDLILNSIYRQSKIRDLKLWGKALARIGVDKKTEIVTTVIFQNDLDFNFNDNAFEGFANFLNSLEEGKAIMVLREEDGQMIKGTLRTTRDDVDVSKIAKEYGGGGHKKAAGFEVLGKIIQDKNGVWKIEKIQM